MTIWLAISVNMTALFGRVHKNGLRKHFHLSCAFSGNLDTFTCYNHHNHSTHCQHNQATQHVYRVVISPENQFSMVEGKRPNVEVLGLPGYYPKCDIKMGVALLRFMVSS